VWFALSLTQASLSTNQKLKTWARKMTKKNPESITEWWEVLMYKPSKTKQQVI